MGACEPEDAQKLVDNVDATHVPEFERVFFERWGTIAESAKYSADSLESLFSRFVAEEYYGLLRAVVQHGQTPLLPRCGVDVGQAPPAAQKHRGELVGATTANKAVDFASKSAVKYKADLEKMTKAACVTLGVSEQLEVAAEEAEPAQGEWVSNVDLANDDALLPPPEAAETAQSGGEKIAIDSTLLQELFTEPAGSIFDPGFREPRG